MKAAANVTLSKKRKSPKSGVVKSVQMPIARYQSVVIDQVTGQL